MDSSFWIAIGSGLLVFVLILALILAVPAVQAKRRGYSFWVWFIAAILVYNPLYLLVVLGISPHRKRQRLREQFRRELDAKLAGVEPPLVLSVEQPAAERSLGDELTRMPGAAAIEGELLRQRSLGDELTRMPEDRSLGDELTRM